MHWAISILIILGCAAVILIAVLYVMRDLLTIPQLPSLWEYDYEEDDPEADDDWEHARAKREPVRSIRLNYIVNTAAGRRPGRKSPSRV